MTVLNRRDYLLSVLIYKLLNNCNDINNCLNINFHLASDTHNYPTRYSQAKSLSVPFAKLDYYKRSLNVTGAKIVNSLSYDLFKLANISLFKTHLQVKVTVTYLLFFCFFVLIYILFYLYYHILSLSFILLLYFSQGHMEEQSVCFNYHFECVFTLNKYIYYYYYYYYSFLKKQ